MSFLLLLTILSVGGGIGGLTSAITEENKHEDSQIKLPFLTTKNNPKSHPVLHLGFLGNMMIGTVAGISIFLFLATFNLEPPSLKKSVSNQSLQQAFQNEFIVPLREQPTVFVQLFAASLLAGYAGISLLEFAKILIKTNLEGDKSESKQDNDQVLSEELIQKLETVYNKLSEDNQILVDKLNETEV